jgi:type VII secretion-associated protein (TIGR03931 family)
MVAGPATITGPVGIAAELADAAMACLDDDIGLAGAEVQDSQKIWADAIADAAGYPVAELTVICPSFWTTTRINRIRRAAYAVASQVRIQDRGDALRQTAGRPTAPVLEVGQDLVVLTRPDRPAVVLRRRSSALAAAVHHALVADPCVIVDVPAGIVGAGRLAADLAGSLRAGGADVTILGCADLCGGAEASAPVRGWQAKLLAAAAAALVVVLLALAVRTGAGSPARPAAATIESTWVIEGRVSMQVPVGWTVDRVTSGTGSARLRITAPDHGGSIHLTQTPVPMRLSLAQSARILRTAAAGLRAGIIVDFNDAATASGRPAVTYREIRAGDAVRWTVLLDDTVRIAIGCQGQGVADACDMAIRSARRIA